MATIKVTAADLDSASGEIQRLAGEYKVQYDSLFTTIDQNLSSWTSEDKTAFITQINGFKDDFERMKELMDEYARFLTRSAEAYRETQQGVIDRAQALTN